MLWVVASLLTLVEVFSVDDNKEAQSDIQRVFSQLWSSAEGLEQDRSIHTPWPQAVG